MAQGIPDGEWVKTVAVARAEVRALLLRSSERVVVDDTFCFRFLRDDFARLARDASRDSRLLVLRTPEEEIRRPITSSARRSDRPGILPAVLERHLATFEWPGDDEPHHGVFEPGAVDAWLAVEAGRW